MTDHDHVVHRRARSQRELAIPGLIAALALCLVVPEPVQAATTRPVSVTTTRTATTTQRSRIPATTVRPTTTIRRATIAPRVSVAAPSGSPRAVNPIPSAIEAQFGQSLPVTGGASLLLGFWALLMIGAGTLLLRTTRTRRR